MKLQLTFRIIILWCLIITPFLITNGYGNNVSHNQSTQSEINSENNDPRVFKVLVLTFDNGAQGTAWLDVIKRENADIILVTETGSWKPSDGSFQAAIDQINDLFPDETPYVGVSSEPQPGFLNDGQTILSRFPIIKTNIIVNLKLDDGTDYVITRDLTHAVVQIDDLALNLLTAHFRCCDALNHRLRETEGIINYLDGLGDVPVLFAGDLNSDSPLDPPELSSPFSTLGTEGIDGWTNKSNPSSSSTHTFTDVYRTLNPNNPGYTFHNPDYDSRTDYIFINDWLTDAMVNSSVSDYYQAGMEMSDHFPLTAWFNLDHEINDIRPPLPVNGFTADLDTVNQEISFTWNANSESNILKYQFYRNSSIHQCLITELPKTETSYIDKAILPNQIYKYQMTVVDEVGNVATPSVPIFINSSYGVVVRPSEPILQAAGVTGGIQLNWTLPDNGGVDDIFYQIYRSGRVDIEKVYHDNTKENQYFDNLVSGKHVYYWVTAHNFAGKSQFSNFADATSKFALESQLNANNVANKHENRLTYTKVINQAANCPVPLNIIDLPIITSNVISSSDTTNSSLTSSIRTESSKEDDSPLITSVAIFAFYLVLLVAKRRRRL